MEHIPELQQLAEDIAGFYGNIGAAEATERLRQALTGWPLLPAEGQADDHGQEAADQEAATQAPQERGAGYGQENAEDHDGQGRRCRPVRGRRSWGHHHRPL
jgi:hypothetical protein